MSHVSPTSTPLSTISLPIFDPKQRRREKEAEEKRRMSVEAAKRFRETFAFLKGTDGAKRRFHVHLVRFGDGNFTGELDKERRRHGWGEMVWSGAGGRYVGKWKEGKQHGEKDLFAL